MSNLVLNNKKSIQDLSFTYTTFASRYGINVVNKTLSSIDSAKKTLTLDDLSRLSYDKLVLATGIDFEKVNDYDITKVPHAWKVGEQTNILKAQIDTMKDGDNFVMSIPKAPYRCPPGYYERACVIADYLKNTKGFTNSKVIVLDANSQIIVEENTFSSVFAKYGVDYKVNCTITNVDDTTKSVTYSQNGVVSTLNSTVLNIIPNQKASPIIFEAGLNLGNWAPINPLSYESTIVNDIHIIGDSQGIGQPKAGHIANSEAKICADAILRSLNSLAPYQSPKTNSACYSPISSIEASWLTAVYKYDGATNTMVLAKLIC